MKTNIWKLCLLASVAAVPLAASWLTAQAPSPAASQPASQPASAACTLETMTLDLGQGVTMKLVQLPAGKFQMGAPEGVKPREPDEILHEVAISRPFWMGATLVTQKQFQAVMKANPSRAKGDELPVDRVSWQMADEFCKKLSQLTGKNVLLPTEAQWEYACRAGSDGKYSKGIADDKAVLDYGWFLPNSDNQTHPVAEKKPNAWCLYDMHGSLWQWCRDWYADYPAGPQKDPQGPPEGEKRVARGGAWNKPPHQSRCANRYRELPDKPMLTHGFRVVIEERPAK